MTNDEFAPENNVSTHMPVRSLHGEKGQALYEALQRRQAFFDSLKDCDKERAFAFQDEIESRLLSAGNVHNRQVILQQMLNESVQQLALKMKDLQGAISQAGALISKLEKDFEDPQQ